MRTNCGHAGCPCRGSGWVEEKRSKMFHECVLGKHRSHTSLRAVQQCKACKVRRNWRVAREDEEEDVGGGGVAPAQQQSVVFPNVTVRVRIAASQPTVAGQWHSLSTTGRGGGGGGASSNNTLEVLSPAANGGGGGLLRIHHHHHGNSDGDGDFSIDLDLAASIVVTCALHQDVLALGVTYSSSSQGVLTLLGDGDGSVIEGFAVQFPSKAAAVEANNLIVPLLLLRGRQQQPQPTHEEDSDTLLLPPTLSHGDLLHLLMDPTLDALVQQAEMILESSSDELLLLLPGFWHSTGFARLCEQVRQVFARGG